MLIIYHSLAYLFYTLHVSSTDLCQFWRLSHLQQCPFPLWFPHPCMVIHTDASPSHWAFILKVPVYLYHCAEPGKVQHAMFI